MRKIALAILAMPLAACGSGEAPPKPLSEAESAMLSPSDPKLAELYAGSCKACHTVKDSLAPLTGDRSVWDTRWAQGEDVLLAAAIQGKKGMPAGGQWFSCTPDDMKALIRFMAGREEKQ